MKKQQPKIILNKNGKEIPIEMIRPDQIKKDKLVKKIFNTGAKLEARIIKDKRNMLKAIYNYQQWLAKHYSGEADFQNLILSDYPNELKVEIKSNSIIEFDEKIQLAESLLKKIISSWAKGANNKFLTVLIDEAFKTDKKGFLDKNRIIGLTQYKINHPDWKAAMKLIQDSQSVIDRKSYMQIKYKDSLGKWNNLNLNFSSAEVE